MSEGDELLKAILEEPGDDGLRLIYADWLEDHDGERGRWRAAMIRGTWDAAGPSRFGTTFPELLRLEVACRKVTGQDSVVLLDGFHHRGAVDSLSRITVSRGFADFIRCPLDVWREHGEQLRRAHPIERVEAVGKEPARWGPGWRWFSGDDESPLVLPGDVLVETYEFARREMKMGGPASNWLFTTREDALDALSGGLLALVAPKEVARV